MGVTGTTQVARSFNSRTDDNLLRFPGQAEGLTRLDRIGLLTLLGAFVIFSGIVQFRGALYPARRIGDWSVFARAAWAMPHSR